MPKKSSDFEFRQQTSLSQRIGFHIPIVQKLAGSDPELSDSIGIILVLCKKGILNEKDPNIQLMLALLDIQRLSHFVTSEKTNEISKMGFMLPAKETVYDGV